MKRDLVVCFLIAALRCAASGGTGPAESRKTLAAAVEIQGYPCDKGHAFFYADGSLSQCSVSRGTQFGEARVPRGSLVHLTPEGKPAYAMLIHDAPILGYTCRGGSWLGPGEGPSVAFYPSGKLKECFLAGDQNVQGVPCMAGSFTADVFGGGSGTFFHQSGDLRSCRLSKDFGALRRGQRITR